MTVAPSTSAKAPLAREKPPGRLDLSAPFALTAGLVLVVTAVAAGGGGWSFIDLPSLIIVIGGTLTVTAASFSSRDLISALRGLRYVTLTPSQTGRTASQAMVRLAERCRKDGIRAAEDALASLIDRPFLHRAVAMSVDGVAPEAMERILWSEAQAVHRRHARTAAVFRRAGDAAPAMGLIGTMIGLVKMLGSLDDPAAIGPAMALALLTTLYGAMLGHMIFHPLAARLERRAGAVFELNTIYALGALAIARQESPRHLELAINAHLARRDKAHCFTS